MKKLSECTHITGISRWGIKSSLEVVDKCHVLHLQWNGGDGLKQYSVVVCGCRQQNHQQEPLQNVGLHWMAPASELTNMMRRSRMSSGFIRIKYPQ